MPTLFESGSSFPDVQAIFDALDDYLAYRCVAGQIPTDGRTYFAGSKFGMNDCLIWGTIRSMLLL